MNPRVWILTVVSLTLAIPLLGLGGPVFDIHGHAKNCSDVTEVDRALASEDSGYFAGWDAKDFANAEEWAERCSKFGDRKSAASRVEQLETVYDDAIGYKARHGNPKPAPSAMALGEGSAPAPTVDPAARARDLAEKLKAENAADDASTPDAPTDSADPPIRNFRLRPSDSAGPIPSEADLIEHGHYTNVDGNNLHSPAHTVEGHAPPQATAQCRDGSYSFSEHHRGTCSSHGGVASWLQ